MQPRPSVVASDHRRARRVCLIPGDGIGQEVIPAAGRVLEAFSPQLEISTADAGYGAFEQHGTSVPDATMRAVESADAALFGATASPTRVVPGYRSAILVLRRRFKLFGCVRRSQSVTGFRGGAPIDVLIVRENTEGLYAGRETAFGDYAEATRLISASASRQVAELAIRLAVVAGRRRITIVHKANILPLTCGLFRDTARAAIEAHGGLQVDEMLVDTAAMRLAVEPERFDVILTTNLFGDILSDIAAGVTGGLGIAASANIGSGGTAVFEPVHGSAPDIAGRGIANPIAALRAAALMLTYIGEGESASRLDRALDLVTAGPVRTPDLGGTSTTAEVTEAVLETLRMTPEAAMCASMLAVERV